MPYTSLDLEMDLRNLGLDKDKLKISGDVTLNQLLEPSTTYSKIERMDDHFSYVAGKLFQPLFLSVEGSYQAFASRKDFTAWLRYVEGRITVVKLVDKKTVVISSGLLALEDYLKRRQTTKKLDILSIKKEF